MDLENSGLVLILLILLPLVFITGFKAGGNYEKQIWKAAIPEQMEQLCIECRGLSR